MTKKEYRKEYFSIPNLMGYFRILLITVYLFLYLRADSISDYRMAALVMILSFLTDFFDGKIARKFDMVTEFGKILDPVADKLTQGAMALSFTFRYPAMGVLFLAFVVKECILGLLGGVMMKRGYRMGGARMHGKICTAVLDAVMFLVLVVQKLSYLQVNLLVTVSMSVMAVSLCLYMKLYWQAWRAQKFGTGAEQKEVTKEKTSKRRRVMVIVVVVIAVVAFLLLGAVLPFVKQPKIQSKTKSQLDLEAFYGTEDSGERVKVISQNGEALEERIRLISQAKEEIILSTFEFDADTSGKMMMSALAEAAQRGVKVSVLVDGFPYITAMWGNPYFLAFAQMDNVELKVYNPIRLWKPWGFMGRLHDKYLIADDKAYILGGRNTYDYFLGDQPGYKNYDWDFLVYSEESKEKASLNQVRDYFRSIWEMPECRTLAKGKLWKHNPSVQKAEREILEGIDTLRTEHGDWFDEADYSSMTLSTNKIQLVSNPTHIFAKEPVVFYTITELMKQAEENVVFHTPYIICNDWMMEQLKEVCSQVDEVRMMTNSVANNGNPFGAMDYQKYKKKILDTGVDILEYDGGVSYHGKCFTIDDRLSAIGSFNWDMRSAYLDTELMLVIDSPEVNQQLRQEMENYEKDALKVVDEDTYDPSTGLVPKKISEKREFRIQILKVAAAWARFLM